MNQDRCTICGERISILDGQHGNRAEMFDPKAAPLLENEPWPEDKHGLVHTQCGLDAGWEIS